MSISKSTAVAMRTFSVKVRLKSEAKGKSGCSGRMKKDSVDVHLFILPASCLAI